MRIFWYNYRMKKIKKLRDEYRFPGYYPKAAIKGKFGDNRARVIRLMRSQKKLNADVAEPRIKISMTAKPKQSGIYPVAMPEFICPWRCAGLTV